MKKNHFFSAFLSITLSLFSITSFAWNHSVGLGYGFSHDPNNVNYNNSGVLLNSDIFPIHRSPWTFWSINGSVGQWHSSAPVNKNLTTAAISLALRFYPFLIAHKYPAYLLGSVGPAYLSSPRFGTNTQASHGSIQTNLGLGTEFNNIDLNLRLSHYSNAGLGHINQGFNVLYLLSLGYLF